MFSCKLNKEFVEKQIPSSEPEPTFFENKKVSGRLCRKRVNWIVRQQKIENENETKKNLKENTVW